MDRDDIRIITIECSNLPFEVLFVLGLVGRQGAVKLVTEDTEEAVLEEDDDTVRFIRSKVVSIFRE